MAGPLLLRWALLFFFAIFSGVHLPASGGFGRFCHWVCVLAHKGCMLVRPFGLALPGAGLLLGLHLGGGVLEGSLRADAPLAFFLEEVFGHVLLGAASLAPRCHRDVQVRISVFRPAFDPIDAVSQRIQDLEVHADRVVGFCEVEEFESCLAVRVLADRVLDVCWVWLG